MFPGASASTRPFRSQKTRRPDLLQSFHQSQGPGGVTMGHLTGVESRLTPVFFEAGWWLSPTPLKNMKVSWDHDSHMEK